MSPHLSECPQLKITVQKGFETFTLNSSSSLVESIISKFGGESSDFFERSAFLSWIAEVATSCLVKPGQAPMSWARFHRTRVCTRKPDPLQEMEIGRASCYYFFFPFGKDPWRSFGKDPRCSFRKDPRCSYGEEPRCSFGKDPRCSRGKDPRHVILARIRDFLSGKFRITFIFKTKISSYQTALHPDAW